MSPDLIDNRLMHIVSQQGETLGKIAAWYTGSQRNWVLLDIEGKPESIKIGDQVLIPERLIVKRDPPPSDYFGKFKKSGKRKASSSTTPQSVRSESKKILTPAEIFEPEAVARQAAKEVTPNVEMQKEKTIAVVEQKKVDPKDAVDPNDAIEKEVLRDQLISDLLDSPLDE